MDFTSDNTYGWAPEIAEAVAAVGARAGTPYGGDEITAEVTRMFCEIFEREVAVYLVATGTAANSLAFATLMPSYGAALVHESAHVTVDECGAPEFFTGGGKLVPISGEAGKIAPDDFRHALRFLRANDVHHTPPRLLSLTQATEWGTIYKPDEIAALSEIAHAKGLAVHMDGARFANALVTLGCSPAEATWQAGVDVMSFGASKNGCMAAEALIFFNPDQVGDVEYRRKRAGHLFSKHRFLSAQMRAYLKDDLWLRLATRANDAARMLDGGLRACGGVEIAYPVEANELFVKMDADVEARLKTAGAKFHPWVVPGDPAGGALRRLVTSFATDAGEVRSFISIAKGDE